ncbi:MAG TPA: hypothetical protein VFL57_01350 [Bryobacteraceae bacterium]|nr:hypothetical protein [Bryobacteraceae bacterium]
MRITLLCFIARALLISGAPPAEEEELRCSVTGAVIASDLLSGTLLVKDVTGSVQEVTPSAGTMLARLAVTPGGSAARVKPSDVHLGDIVCVHAAADRAQKEISVVARADVQRAQRDFLIAWQRSAVYGTIWSIDVPARTLVVLPVPPSPHDVALTINLAPDAELRSVPRTARRLSDLTPFELRDLQVGEQIFVRGTRDVADPAITASLVLKGGYRAVLGTLIDVQPLASTIKVREYGTGRKLSILLPGGEVFRTTESITQATRVDPGAGIMLAPAEYADLEKGDAIVVVGRINDQTSEGEGLAVITKFGTFGIVPRSADERIVWFIR